MILLYLLLSLVLLYLGAEYLVRGASSLAARTGVSPLVIGLTVVAYGTSAPEMAASVYASLNANGDIAVSNIIGSNIFNLAFILGLTAVVCPVTISLAIIRRDMPVLIGVSVLAAIMLADNHLGRLEGAVLLAGAVIYTFWIFVLARKEPATISGDDSPRNYSIPKSILMVLVSLGVLVAGSRLLVTSAIEISRFLGLSEAVIGLTVVSFGTSVPELATSIVAALRKQTDMAVGNVVGSNIFNILGILGVSSLVAPCDAQGITNLDLAVMLAVAFTALPLLWSGFVLNRKEGALLLAMYSAYICKLLGCF